MPADTSRRHHRRAKHTMRIMQIVSGGDVNGATVHGLDLTRELARQGHEVTLVCRPRAWIRYQSLPAGVEIVELPLNYFSGRDTRQISRLIRESRIDVIHSHQTRASNFALAMKLLTGVPSVATAHSRHLEFHWMWHDHVIAVSEATRDFHRRFNLCPSRRLSVIHCFVDTDRYRPQPDLVRRAVRQEFGVAPDEPLLGIIGQVCQRKGLIHLVESLRLLDAASPRARVLIIGIEDPPYAELVRETAKKLHVADRLIWADQRRDIDRLYGALDVLVVPSLEEQIPIAMLEAMACGLPIVATHVGGIPECITDGVEGLLVPPANPESLALALWNVLENGQLREQLAQAGRRRITEQFSRERNTQRVVDVLAEVARRRNSKRWFRRGTSVAPRHAKAA
jgi:glycosyltransferase involved in cell wall biosynthesis